MSEIKIGDTVRSFDFDGRDLDGERACYIEGEVIAIVFWEGCDRYKIKVSDRIFRGVNVSIGEDYGEVLPPVNGTPTSLGRICNGVVKMISN